MKPENYNLRPLQLAILDVFKVFAQICEKHGFKYYAAYGTALGAIRHKGFIPWDDDLDVIMPRADYNEFVKVVPNELPIGIKFLRGGESLYSPVLFGKLLDVREGIVDSLNRATNLTLKDPPFVDVFVLEGIPDGGMRGFRRWKRNQKLWRLCQVWRYPRSGYRSACLNRLVAKMTGWLFDWQFRKTVNNEDMMRVFDEVSAKWEGSEYVAEPSFFRMMENRLLPRSYFEPSRLVPFENTHIRIAAKAEEILIRYYGDYTRLPPEADRVPSHVFRHLYDGHV